MMIQLPVFSVGIAALCAFLHYVIGSPLGAEYSRGRPFSFYGRFITNMYAKHEAKEQLRIDAKKAIVKAELDAKYTAKMNNISPADFAAFLIIAQQEYEKAAQEIEHQYRINIFSLFGCCPICFFTWISLFSWCILLCILNTNLLLLPLLVPVSVVIANRIQL